MFLRRKNLLLHSMFILCSLLASFAAISQETVKGKVLNGETQQPVPGASVNVKGNKKTVLTNNAGEFAIIAKQGDIIEVTSIGFLKAEIAASEASAVQLAVDNKNLSEVVVTALGIKKEKKKVVYAIQEVKGSEFIKAREPNAVSGMKGKVAGLNVNISSEMLRQPSINFRGEGSILFVVDGVPITTDTWNISADDIETYTFLKGQTASALYGSLARNGAIIISTKKGTKDKRGYSIEFNSSTMVDHGFLAFPIIQDEYGPGSKGLYAFKDGVGGGVNDNDYDVWGPRFEGQLLPQYDGKYTSDQTYTTIFKTNDTLPLEFVGNIKPTPWTARGKDNLKRFIKPGLLSTNHIAIAATGDKYNLRFGVGHTYQDAILPNMSLNITNLNLNAGYEFSKKLKVSANVNYSRQYSENFPDVNYGPNSMLYNMVIWAGADWNVDDMKNYWQPGKVGVQQIYAEYQRYNNPWFMVKEWLRPHYKNDLYSYISLNWKLAENFEFVYRPSMASYDILRQEKMPYSAGSYGRDLRMGGYSEDRRTFFESNNEIQLKYNSRINNFLSIDGVVGGNVRTARYNGSYASTDYLNIPGLYNLSNSLFKPAINNITIEGLFLSAYYTLDLGVSKFLNVTTTGRLDKVSTLRQNTFFYPSLGISSVISDFINLPQAISFLKLRASVAQGRNSGIYQYIGQPKIDFGTGNGYGQQYYTPFNMGTYDLVSQTYNLSTDGYNQAQTATFPNEILDPNLTADDKNTFEAGIDVRLFKNLMNIEVTGYYSEAGLISNRDDIISPASGYSSLKTNYGSYKNTGFEVTLSSTPIESKDFSWDININWSTFTRKWIEHPNPNNWSKNGSRIDLMYSQGFVRTPDGQLVHGEDGLLMRFSDAGKGDAKRIFGHSDPDWSWGIKNTLSYKNVKLGFQFDGLVGGLFHDYIRKKTLQGGRHLETAAGLWGQHRPNDVRGGSFVAPGITLTGGDIILDGVTGEITNMKDLKIVENKKATSIQSYSSRFANLDENNIISKTFSKLREIVLSYQLPTSLIKNTFIQRADISLIGRNLLLFFPKKYKDVDPDQFTQDSGSILQTPTTRRYGINLNISF